MITRDACVARDREDPLAPLRDLFELPAGKIYLDGNSLGALPRATAGRVASVVAAEWGRDLVTSWNKAGWMDLPRRVGDKIARLIGAAPGEVIAADSTSVNLYKALSAAAAVQGRRRPGRRVILSERSNFPTDLYIAHSLCESLGWTLRLVETQEIEAQLADDVAVLMLTHVNYRTGRMHDLAGLTATAHAAGALVVWDLAHSAGAVPVDLNGARADFAVGCGYKYLNGGPGAPAFVFARADHAEAATQPLAGWLGHAAPFAFTPGYRPAPGMTRYLCGTPPILSLAALDCGVDTVLAAEPLGGIAAIREKSLALCGLFEELVRERCPDAGFALVSPADPARRGSQICLTRAEGGYAIVQALIAQGVIGDFRAGDADMPDILRFGFTPLYTRYVDVFDAVDRLAEVMAKETWRSPDFARRHAVT